MTSFADPDLIACPHCEHKFMRNLLCSFNNMWEVTYSDGGSRNGLSDYVIDVTRCTNCCEIMLDVQNIPTLGAVTKPPFWKRWFVNAEEYLYLPRPTSDVYLELFEKSADAEKKMEYALQAFRLFNRTYHLENKNTQPSLAAQQQYKAVGDYILASPPNNYLPEYELLCADIYRQRGQFDEALDTYAKVSDERLQYIVEQGVTWVKTGQTALKLIQPRLRYNAQNAAPIIPEDEEVVCNIEVKNQCPKQWHELTPVSGKLNQRFCDHCKQTVYQCGSQKEFKYHASQQHCIAADIEYLKLSKSVLKKISPELSVGKMEPPKYELNDPKVKND